MILAIVLFSILAIGGILLSYRMGYREGYKQALTALSQEFVDPNDSGPIPITDPPDTEADL